MAKSRPRPVVTIDDDWSQYGTVTFEFDHKKGGRIDEAKVKAFIKRLKLDTAAAWAECWRDDDSPQAEKTFGVRP